MIPTAYQLRDFYKTLGGRIVRRILRDSIDAVWPSSNGLRVLGAGYAVPYIKHMMDGSERTFAVMFSSQGIHHWPDGENNFALLCNETDLPVETNSVDRIVIIHSLEFTGLLNSAFEEFYRILKSNGRIMVIVPNRMGLWARAEWTPFGRGTPYSASQVQDFLKENLFVPEQTRRALFIPPFKSQTLLRSAGLWEKLGARVFPAMGGVLMVEASKQIYATTGKATPVTKKVPIKLQEESAGVKRMPGFTSPKDCQG